MSPTEEAQVAPYLTYDLSHGRESRLWLPIGVLKHHSLLSYGSSHAVGRGCVFLKKSFVKLAPFDPESNYIMS